MTAKPDKPGRSHLNSTVNTLSVQGFSGVHGFGDCPDKKCWHES